MTWRAAVLCGPTSAKLVIVGLQQGLGNIRRLTAGQVLTGALLLQLTAAAAAAATTPMDSSLCLLTVLQRQPALSIPPFFVSNFSCLVSDFNILHGCF